MAVDVSFGFDLTDPRTILPAARNLARSFLGFDSPEEQMIAAAIVFVASLVSSVVSLGATLVLTFIALVFFAIGALRFAWARVR